MSLQAANINGTWTQVWQLISQRLVYRHTINNNTCLITRAERTHYTDRDKQTKYEKITPTANQPILHLVTKLFPARWLHVRLVITTMQSFCDQTLIKTCDGQLIHYVKRTITKLNKVTSKKGTSVANDFSRAFSNHTDRGKSLTLTILDSPLVLNVYPKRAFLSAPVH